MDMDNGAPAGAAEGSFASADQGGAGEQMSTRDAVAAAFAKLEGGNEGGAVEGGQEGQGGQPGTQQDQPQRALTPDARARDEQGRFRTPDQPQGAPAQGQLPAQQPQKAGEPGKEAQPDLAQRIGPPPGWSPQSKDAFAALPDHVKQDIAKREQEVNAGLAELKDYRDLRPFRDMAARSGTNLGNVLGELTKFEDTVAKDPIAAVGALSHLYGFDLGQVVVGLAQRMGLQVVQGGQPQFYPQQPAQLPREVLERLARVDMIEQRLSTQATTQMQSAIQAFADDQANEFFENVGREMQQIISADLARFRSMPPQQAVKEAYDQAVWLNPETRAVLIKRQAEEQGRAQVEQMRAAADQARRASKGLSGSPVNGATPGSAQPIPQTTRDAAAAAFDMHANL